MTQAVKAVELRVEPKGGHARILTPEALEFVAGLHRQFEERRQSLLQARRQLQARLDAGEKLQFLPETKAIREGQWKVAPLPDEIQDRRVEITGPAEAKMVINALNSGANVFMADFEDSLAPSFDNLVEGQLALYDAVRKNLAYDAPGGKQYRLNGKLAVLFVRPRGWHLPEVHMRVDGKPVSASLFDFGLFFFHNAKEQLSRGTGPYFYLPKMEHHLEARLWNDVFLYAEKALGIPRGAVKATVLIETLPAAFQMEEILYELREHSAGLNCGRWDYIFSFIKKHASDPAAIVPDRSQLTMDKGFLRAYAQLLVQTCHRRGAHAMGGMSAFIPVKDNPQATEAALSQVRADKLREVQLGHDGTWVAHPALVPVAKAIFDEHLPTKNQIQRPVDGEPVSSEALLKVPQGTRSEAGLRQNIRIGVRYLESWLRGVGCVPLYQLMEDAATAEISRAQVWQELHFRAAVEGVGQLTPEIFSRVLEEELQQIRREVGETLFDSGKFGEAAVLFRQLATAPRFEEFLTLPAYAHLARAEA